MMNVKLCNKYGFRGDMKRHGFSQIKYEMVQISDLMRRNLYKF